jgi:hypothetical protein
LVSDPETLAPKIGGGLRSHFLCKQQKRPRNLPVVAQEPIGRAGRVGVISDGIAFAINIFRNGPLFGTGPGLLNIEFFGVAVRKTYESVAHVVLVNIVSGDFQPVIDSRGVRSLARIGSRAIHIEKSNSAVTKAKQAMQHIRIVEVASRYIAVPV